MSYRLAYSLVQLREQINEAFPNRDKTSDGWIGDTSHATRASDHNPWVTDGVRGVVTAIDIDEDLSGSVHSLSGMIDAICMSKDERVKYIIYEGRITVKGSNLQQWKRYLGKNKHSHHAHISVHPSKALYDNDRDWSLSAVDIVAAPPESLGLAQFYFVVRGDTLSGIARKFTTSVDKLMEMNLLTSTVIQIGQKLQVK